MTYYIPARCEVLLPSENGTFGMGPAPAAGGAMDLAVGAKQTRVMMDLLTNQGESKLVQACTYTLTGVGCVKRIYSDLATLACTAQVLKLIDKVEGSAHAELVKLVGFPVHN